MQKTEKEFQKKFFEKIKINNIYNILYFLDYFTIAEISFLNKSFKGITQKKFKKRIKMITASCKIYKKKIKFDFIQDFQYLLANNSSIITKEIKPFLVNTISDYYYKLPVLKYYINKLPKKKFSKFSLKNLNLGKKSIKYLSYYIENNCKFEKLKISKNKLTENILLPISKTIETAKNLHTLKLNKCTIDYTTIINLNEILNLNSKIENLSLRNCNLEDDMILSLKFLNNLKKINFGGNKISTNGLKHILKSTNKLEILNLEKNHLNSTSALYLSMFLANSDCKIQELYLGDNYITTSGIRSLFLSLHSNPKSELKVLSINKNVCENFGNLFLDKTNLKTFEVASFKFDYNQLAKLMNSLNTNRVTRVNLNGNSCFMKEKIAELFFEELKDNQSITNINLDNCYISLGKFCNFLLNYFKNPRSKINQLSLAWNNLYNIDSSVICEIIFQNKLKYLNLSNNELNLWTEKKFKNFVNSLGNNSSIEKVNLSNNNLGEFVCILFDNLKFNESLIELNIENNKINEISISESFKNFLNNNISLKVLSMSKNDLTDIFVNDHFKNLIENKNIAKLDFSKNDISIDGVVKIVNYLISSKKNLDKLIILRSEFLNSTFYNRDIDILRENIDKFTNLII